MVAMLKDGMTEEKLGTITFNVRGDKSIRNTVKWQAARREHLMSDFARKLIEIGLREVEKNPEILNEITV